MANRPNRHYLRSLPQNARRALVRDARRGGVTLVLGAGVSLSRGLRSWPDLVRAMWRRVTGDERLPDWMGAGGAKPHPLAYQMVFEELEHALRAEEIKAARDNGGELEAAERASERFAALLAQELYRDFADGPRSGDTLDVLARLLRQEQASPTPRIERVITFNADDLLEIEANRGHSYQSAPVVWAVPRASFHPRRGGGAGGRSPIQVYHLHGYLPNVRNRRASPDTLVFTDAQYWRSLANPASFANRVFAGALQDSHCVFIGLSMEDVNLMRWLGLRHVEFEDDFLARYGAPGTSTKNVWENLRDNANRHFWITTEGGDPSRIIASHLERRGVRTLVLEGWGAPFEELIEECFPAPAAAD
ncbi:SIR2 family protein [Engelhardtia mirabilis]|uniref:Uncharacterized protein n=1 Tax=Engelhardtia mirabilis TaxID=2528011 RepID=A0A518BFP2_9BACT|nr:hypothetical protein Pla133_08660 [Planctomycetes bacterium Pla133]QDV00126.1 hypothetical protein Pla86_08650 [Planctomycetes bacterium Pla86]